MPTKTAVIRFQAVGRLLQEQLIATVTRSNGEWRLCKDAITRLAGGEHLPRRALHKRTRQRNFYMRHVTINGQEPNTIQLVQRTGHQNVLTDVPEEVGETFELWATGAHTPCQLVQCRVMSSLSTLWNKSPWPDTELVIQVLAGWTCALVYICRYSFRSTLFK